MYFNSFLLSIFSRKLKKKLTQGSQKVGLHARKLVLSKYNGAICSSLCLSNNNNKRMHAIYVVVDCLGNVLTCVDRSEIYSVMIF